MHKTRCLPAAALASVLALSGSAFSAEPGTGSWLLESCRGEHGDAGRAFCLGYTMGLSDLMLGQQRICLPETVSSEQLRTAVENHLAARPGDLNQHPVLLVIQALDASFPCQ